MLLFNEIDFKKMTLKEYFNTSNVTIQLIVKTKQKGACKISIHLMLLFNVMNRRFGWNLPGDFNTSNVTIQRLLLLS